MAGALDGSARVRKRTAEKYLRTNSASYSPHGSWLAPKKHSASNFEKLINRSIHCDPGFTGFWHVFCDSATDPFGSLPLRMEP
jgi:hypothetical protein